MGTFDGTLEGKEYKVEVTCSNLDQGDFQFRSDKTDIDDTNGDGIIIYGTQNQGRFLLTLTDHGTTYSASNIQKFARSLNGAEGEGLLYVDGQADVPYVRFSVDCG